MDSHWTAEAYLRASYGIFSSFFHFLASGQGILAAGAIKPADGFRYAFENGADFICIGMFDWQVVENVNTAISVLNSRLNRERKWFA